MSHSSFCPQKDGITQLSMEDWHSGSATLQILIPQAGRLLPNHGIKPSNSLTLHLPVCVRSVTLSSPHYTCIWSLCSIFLMTVTPAQFLSTFVAEFVYYRPPHATYFICFYFPLIRPLTPTCLGHTLIIFIFAGWEFNQPSCFFLFCPRHRHG